MQYRLTTKTQRTQRNTESWYKSSPKLDLVSFMIGLHYVVEDVTNPTPGLSPKHHEWEKMPDRSQTCPYERVWLGMRCYENCFPSFSLVLSRPCIDYSVAQKFGDFGSSIQTFQKPIAIRERYGQCRSQRVSQREHD